ncbi:S26 family signal peptidase [Bradyrhizobium sp. th.b2]|uniref:S26 family signal peptidase n=1 Tax=Bradyrhizobium sp. th-b2 TaxID=172088 RepID=UPI00040EF975|nr:S26 family signal peptidase [Bradyrhizobium sp. th.b2]
MQDHWLDKEFARSGLPKSALASYLGVEKAAVSRAVSGERQLNREDTDLAHAFFSIVPPDAPESLTEAIHRLRSTKVREAAGLMLSRWLLERVDEGDIASRDFFGPVASQNTTLRADQIVALCRLLGIDFGELVQGFGVRSRNNLAPPRNLLDALQSEAERWPRRGTVPYQFDRNSEASPPRLATSKTRFVTLQPADPSGEDLTSCVPYLIPDDSYAPRFEQGQTIYLDAYSEPRKGDYVAVVIKDSNSWEVKAVLGRLLYVSRDQIGLESLKNTRTEVPRSDVSEFRRIGFCKM